MKTLLILIALLSASAAAPVITTIFVGGDPLSDHMRVTWKTDVPASSVVEYGPTSAYGHIATGGIKATEHEVFVPKPPRKVELHFRVRSLTTGGKGTDCKGDEACSPDMIMIGRYQ